MDLSSIGNVTANITTMRLVNPDKIDLNEYPNTRTVYADQMTVSIERIYYLIFGINEAMTNSDFYFRLKQL